MTNANPHMLSLLEFEHYSDIAAPLPPIDNHEIITEPASTTENILLKECYLPLTLQ